MPQVEFEEADALLDLSGKRLCVYCGARNGTVEIHTRQAEALGAALAARGAGLVYGGGSVGLMGAVADAIVRAGGDAVGVIPTHLHDAELGHAGIRKLETVPDMHIRKARMIELSDAIVALPGGIGTLEELAEAMTWRQLGLHSKPVGVIDSGGYYSDLFAVLESMVDSGFADLSVLTMLKRFDSAEDLVAQWQQGIWV